MYYTDYVCIVASVFQTEIIVKFFLEGLKLQAGSCWRAPELHDQSPSMSFDHAIRMLMVIGHSSHNFVSKLSKLSWVIMASWCNLLLHIINHHQSTAGRWLPMISRSNIQLPNVHAADLEEGRAVELVRAFEDHKYIDVSIFPDTFSLALTILQAAWRKSSEKPAMLWISLFLPSSSYIVSSSFHAICLCKCLVLLGQCLFVAEHFDFGGFFRGWRRESALCGKNWQD